MERTNLKHERKYEKAHKKERLLKKLVKNNMRNKARTIVEKKTWKAIPKGMTVDHIKPLSKWWTNAPSNLRIVTAKKNYGDGWRMRAKKKTQSK